MINQSTVPINISVLHWSEEMIPWNTKKAGIRFKPSAMNDIILTIVFMVDLGYDAGTSLLAFGLAVWGIEVFFWTILLLAMYTKTATNQPGSPRKKISTPANKFSPKQNIKVMSQVMPTAGLKLRWVKAAKLDCIDRKSVV